MNKQEHYTTWQGVIFPIFYGATETNDLCANTNLGRPQELRYTVTMTVCVY